MYKDKNKSKYVLADFIVIDDYEYSVLYSFLANNDKPPALFCAVADGWEVITNTSAGDKDDFYLKRPLIRQDKTQVSRFEMMDI